LFNSTHKFSFFLARTVLLWFFQKDQQFVEKKKFPKKVQGKKNVFLKVAKKVKENFFSAVKKLATNRP
jgi:hypothetical protein